VATSRSAKAHPRAAAACLGRRCTAMTAGHQCFRDSDSAHKHHAAMASQPPTKPKASRWGSLLAVVEQGLDTILADTDDASARSRVQDNAAANEKPSADEPTALVVPNASSDASRSPSRSRVNERLQAKLAKAAANRNSSRSTTPLNQPASPRSSIGSRQSIDTQQTQTEPKDDTTSIPGAHDTVPNGSDPTDYTTVEPVPESLASDFAPDLTITEIAPTLLTSGLPINPARISSDSETRPTTDVNHEARAEEAAPNPDEESESNSSRGIATGKMRSQTLHNDKDMAELRQRLTRFEHSELDLKQRLRRAEQAEQQNAEKLKRFMVVEKDLESHKSDLASSNARIVILRNQLLEAEKQAEKVQDSATQASNQKLSAIQEQLEDARLEKKLVEDRRSAEVKRVTEEARLQKQQASLRETELTNEIAVSLGLAREWFTRAMLMCEYRITKVVSKLFESVPRRLHQM